MTPNKFFSLEASLNLRCWVIGLVIEGGAMLMFGPLIFKVRCKPFQRSIY